jgi:hypothetical protein
MFTEQLSQALSIAAPPVQPQTLNNSSASTGNGGVDMAKFRRALFVVQVGAVTGGGSLTAKLQSSANGTGGWADVAGSTITAITASNKVATLEVRSDELAAGQRYVRCTLTEGGAQNVVCGCLPLGAEAVQKPGSANDDASVAQRLVV